MLLEEQEFRLLFETARRSSSPVTLGMMDIDHFKKINDTYGHQTGDMILKKPAQCCKNILLDELPAYRFGGDEVVFLFPHTDSSQAYEILEDIRSCWRSSQYLQGDFPITLSFGIYSTMPTEETTLASMMDKADKALYESKHQGRDRITVFGN